MADIFIDVPRSHVNQQHIKKTAQRFNVLNCGRRFGKTLLGEDLTIKPALDSFPVGWYSPTYKDMAEVWRDLKRIYMPVISQKSEVEKRLEFITGGSIDLWSLEDPDSSRGRKYKRIIVDEAAKVKKLEDAWTQTIRPTLADYQGDAYFLSTPKGLNYFHTLWTMAGGDRADWERWQYSTYDNPHIRPAEIDAMRDMLPERVFRQEILAEFLEDGAYFQGVDEAAIIADREHAEMHNGHSVMMGVDWAISNDYTVITVGCRECNQVVDWDRFNQIDFTYQRERLYNMSARWPQLIGCLPERNSIGLPNIEIIRTRVPVLSGVDGNPGFNTTSTTKPELIQGLASAIEHDGFKIPMDAADELRVYEVERTLSNNLTFGAPEGLHDDWVISLALLWRAMSKATRLPDNQPTQPSKWLPDENKVTTGEKSRFKRY